LLYAITLILCNPGISVARLAEKCSVTERTIYRDIIDISEANIPIYFDNGYRILDTGRVPPLNFTSDELIYLYNILHSKSHSEVFGGVGNRLADKLRRHIPGILNDKNIEFHTHSTDTPALAKIFARVEKTISSGKIISFKYTSLNGKTSRRNVHPYGLVFRGHGWYLVGYCEAREEVRIFRLVRISNLRATQKAYNKPADFSIDEFLDESWSVFRGKYYNFKVKFTGPAAVAVSTTCHHKDEKIVKKGKNHVIYSVKSRGKEEFINWVLSYGKHAELLEPVHLRQEIIKRMEISLSKYVN